MAKCTETYNLALLVTVFYSCYIYISLCGRYSNRSRSFKSQAVVSFSIGCVSKCMSLCTNPLHTCCYLLCPYKGCNFWSSNQRRRLSSNSCKSQVHGFWQDRNNHKGWICYVRVSTTIWRYKLKHFALLVRTVTGFHIFNY